MSRVDPIGSDSVGPDGFRLRAASDANGIQLRRVDDDGTAQPPSVLTQSTTGGTQRGAASDRPDDSFTVTRDPTVGSDKWKARGGLGVKVGMGMVGGAAGVALGSLAAGAVFGGMIGGGIALLGPIALGVLGVGVVVACVGFCVMHHNGADKEDYVAAFMEGAKAMTIGFLAGFAGGYCCGPGIEVFQMGMTPLETSVLATATTLYQGMTLGAMGAMYMTAKGVGEAIEEERRRKLRDV